MTELNNGWPDPARPGVPMNPDWTGWHHWLSYQGEEPGLYEWDGKYWKMGGGHAPMDYVVDHFTYIAPVLTPAEVEARVKEARRDALEDCAKWHDEQAVWMIKGRRMAKAEEHRKHAAAIRALKGEGDE